MFSKSLALWMRIKPRFERSLFNLHIIHNLTIMTHSSGSKRRFPITLHRTNNKSQIIRPDIHAKTRTFRVYNTQSGEFEYYTREDPDV